jgi:hypothetical protein
MPIALKSSGGGSVTLDTPVTASTFTLTVPALTATVATTTGTFTNPTINGFTGDTSVVNIGSGQIYKDSSGNLGIGTSSPSYKLDVNGSISATDLRSQNIYVYATAGNYCGFGFYSSSSLTNRSAVLETQTGTATTLKTDGATPLILGTNATERARIDSSGNLLVGTTSYAAGQNAIKLNGSSSNFSRNSTAASAQIYFENPNGTVGQISSSGSSTSYLTSSDYRLKNSVAPMTTGLSTVSALKPVTYKWNVDDSDGEGFIAHELQAVIPHAVTGEKDAVDADGNPIHQGVDYSKIVVHLVAACQELKADLDAAKAEIAALKGNA